MINLILPVKNKKQYKKNTYIQRFILCILLKSEKCVCEEYDMYTKKIYKTFVNFTYYL